jgi:hypothetical protein
MLEMVEARRNTDKEEQRHDLFSGLLEAADDGEKLNDEELLGGSLTLRSFRILGKGLTSPLGNMFIFLLAGHEVQPFTFSRCSALIQFLTDHSAYAMFLICTVGSLS